MFLALNFNQALCVIATYNWLSLSNTFADPWDIISGPWGRKGSWIFCKRFRNNSWINHCIEKEIQKVSKSRITLYYIAHHHQERLLHRHCWLKWHENVRSFHCEKTYPASRPFLDQLGLDIWYLKFQTAQYTTLNLIFECLFCSRFINELGIHIWQIINLLKWIQPAIWIIELKKPFFSNAWKMHVLQQEICVAHFPFMGLFYIQFMTL